MNTRIYLCTGGAASGKSLFAEKLALSTTGQKLYIATSQIFDKEMLDKVNLHKMRRDKSWNSIELQKELSSNLLDLINKNDILLLDCVTMYIMNYFMEYTDFSLPSVKQQLESEIINEFKRILEIIAKTEGKTFIFVTNELGSGIVPLDSMSRLYRNIVGKINQLLADKADKVYLSVSGITIEIKSQEVQFNG